MLNYYSWNACRTVKDNSAITLDTPTCNAAQHIHIHPDGILEVLLNCPPRTLTCQRVNINIPQSPYFTKILLMPCIFLYYITIESAVCCHSPGFFWNKRISLWCPQFFSVSGTWLYAGEQYWWLPLSWPWVCTQLFFNSDYTRRQFYFCVTMEIKGVLCGCIGRFFSPEMGIKWLQWIILGGVTAIDFYIK